MIAERPFIGTSLRTARRIAALAFLLSSFFAMSAVVLHARAALLQKAGIALTLAGVVLISV